MNIFRIVRSILFIFCCLLPLASQAAVNNDRFQKANAAYSRNDFSTAISIYEMLVSEHGYSQQLLYNLGNSYAQSGQVGKAILNYERALHLAPHNSDVLGNLHLVLNARGLFNEKPSFTMRILHLLSINQWTVLAGAGLFLLSAGLALSLRFPVSRRTLLLFTFGCLATTLTGVIGTAVLHKEWSGYVVIDESRLLISPFEGAAAAGNIQEGRVVYPNSSHGEYLHVHDRTGRKGWISQVAIEPIIPQKR